MDNMKELNLNELETVNGGGVKEVLAKATPEERAEFERLKALYEDACARTRGHHITIEEYCRISDAYHKYYTELAMRYEPYTLR